MNPHTKHLVEQIDKLKQEALPTHKKAAIFQVQINRLTETLKKTCDHSEVETRDISTPPESRVDATYCRTCDSWNVHRRKQT